MKKIRWLCDIDIKNFNEISGDFGDTEIVHLSPKSFKQGDISEVKYVFKHGKSYKYVVFDDDTISIVHESNFTTIM